MKRSIQVVGLMLFLAAVGWSSPEDDAYFPLNEGFSWVYKTHHKTKKDTFDMNVVVEGRWKDDGQSGMILTQKDKRFRMRQFLIQNEKGIFVHRLVIYKGLKITNEFSPAVPFVIYPLKPGTKVHWEGNVKNIAMNKRIVFDGEVVGEEEIDVPAGRFKCVKLHYKEKRGDENIEETAWYAEGVGQVKYDGGEYVKELASYEAPKK